MFLGSLYNNIDPEKIESLVSFTFNFFYFYIPCLLGAFTMFYLKKIKNNEKIKVMKIFLYSVTPSIILVMIEAYFSSSNNINPLLFLGVSYFGGLCCIKITETCMSIKEIVKFLTKIEEISSTIKRVMSEINEFKDESNGDDKDD